MFAGLHTCPRCQGTHWHRDMKAQSNVGVFTTQLICIRCGERLLVRSTRQEPERCLVVRRWSLYNMGKLKPAYREWTTKEPYGDPVYKG